MTTTRQNPIDRALERLAKMRFAIKGDLVHTILTDLAAEIRAECMQDYDGLDEDEIPTRLPDTLYLSEVWRSDQGLFFVCVPNDQPRVKRMAKYRNEFALGTPAEARLAAVRGLRDKLRGYGSGRACAPNTIADKLDAILDGENNNV